MNDVLIQLQNQFATYAPNLLSALVVLVVGWLIALLLASIVRRVLRNLTLDNKLARWMAGPTNEAKLPVEDWGTRAVFYLAMLFVLVAFFQTLKLTIITEPLNQLIQSFTGYIPKLVGAGILIVVAWVLATVLKKLLAAALKGMKLDERLGAVSNDAATDNKSPSLSVSLSEAVYWLVFLLFLPLILGALELRPLLDPINEMLKKFFNFIPNLIAAGITLLVGWFVARIVQRLVASLLATAGIDALAARWNLGAALGKRKLSEIVGYVLYGFILLPVVVAGLGELQLDAVTRPASDMLGKILQKLPDLFGAALVVIIFGLVGKIVGEIVANLLAGLGFNNILVRLGLSQKALDGQRAPATVVGLLIRVAFLITATATAAGILGFDEIRVVLQDFLPFGGHILLGVVIFCLGLFLAQIVSRAISASDSPKAQLLAAGARVAILTVVGSMALEQTRLSPGITNLAFTLTIGAIAVAFGLAFGLGGRDTAAKICAEWKEKLDRKQV